MSERLERYWIEETSCNSFAVLSGNFGGESFAEDSEWGLGDVMIMNDVSG